MSTEKPKVPTPVVRSLIPVPQTYSLQRLPKTQSIDNLNTTIERVANNSIHNGLNRKITRTVSISRLPTSRLNASDRPCPPIARAVTGAKSVTDLVTNNASKSQSNPQTPKVCPKLFKPNGNHISCQRFQKNHTNFQNQKQISSFKIYNRFSPYYENESIEYQNNSFKTRGDIEQNSSMSSSESSYNSRITIQSDDQQNSDQQSGDNQQLYRCQSVPEHIQTQENSYTNSYKSDTKNDNWIQAIDKQFIERLKNRIIESIDNEDELDDDLEDDNCMDSVLPQNVENKLLRVVIRHLKEKLSESKASVEKMSQQLTSNKQMSEAFQKSLSTMTIRAQQLTQQLDTKHKDFDELCLQLKDKNLEYEDLNRKYHLIDAELKKLHFVSNNNNNNNNDNNVRTVSSMSSFSSDVRNSSIDGSVRLKRMTSSWLRGSTLSKAFKRKKKSKSVTDLLSSPIETSEGVSQLRDIIRQKELTINDLRLQSIQTCNQLERLEDDLKLSKEETNHLKKSKDFLEKMMKMKILE